MMIPGEFLDRLRKCVRISQVARMKLKREGAEFRAVDNHSLAVNDKKGTWKDFANGEKGGDIFKFFQVSEGLSFPEAVKHVAKIAGLEIPSGGNGHDRSKRGSWRVSGRTITPRGSPTSW
jgi:DNA primase